MISAWERFLVTPRSVGARCLCISGLGVSNETFCLFYDPLDHRVTHICYIISRRTLSSFFQSLAWLTMTASTLFHSSVENSEICWYSHVDLESLALQLAIIFETSLLASCSLVLGIASYKVLERIDVEVLETSSRILALP